jgi:hypothetical protein
MTDPHDPAIPSGDPAGADRDATRRLPAEPGAAPPHGAAAESGAGSPDAAAAPGPSPRPGPSPADTEPAAVPPPGAYAGPPPGPVRPGWRNRLPGRPGLWLAALALVAACLIGLAGVAVGTVISHGSGDGDRGGNGWRDDRGGDGDRRPGDMRRDGRPGGQRHGGDQRWQVPPPPTASPPPSTSPTPSTTP